MTPMDLHNNRSDDPRVLLVDLSRRFGGASVRALTLVEHMQSGVAAIAVLKDGAVMKIAEERNIPIRIVGKHRLDPLIPFRLRNIVRRDCFQIIDTQNIQSKLWGSLTALITDVAFVATLNSSYKDEHGRALKGKLYTFINRWTNFKTDRFIAVSEPIRQGLIIAGISATRVDLVTNAVELGASIPEEEPVPIRAQIGIPEGALVCASVGRLVWAKGYEDFIAAFASVSTKVPDAFALILGDGVLHSSLSKQIKEAGLGNKIFLLGHCEQRKVWSVLRASDIFVLSSRSEGVPIALLEAAAFGLPIVATRCGGIPDVLTDNVDALLVPVGDIPAISAGIMKLYQDRQFAKKIGSQAQLKVTCEYGIQKQIEATRSAYRKALEHKRMRS